MPTYSPDGPLYHGRVRCNGRGTDPEFDTCEHLYRRYPRSYLKDGKPIPLTMSFEDHSGISVNRGKYSEPQDVLEPDCCEGQGRPNCVVLDFLVSDVPGEIPVNDNSGRRFQFCLAHKPTDSCYAHSEIWCNEDGDPGKPYQAPPKSVRNLFRGELARKLAQQNVLEFAPQSEA